MWMEHTITSVREVPCTEASGHMRMDISSISTEVARDSQMLIRCLGKQDSYEIKVNKTTNVVTVYAKDGNKGYIIPVKAFVCSGGDTTPLEHSVPRQREDGGH